MRRRELWIGCGLLALSVGCTSGPFDIPGGDDGGRVGGGGVAFGPPIAVNLPAVPAGGNAVDELALSDVNGDGKLDAVITCTQGCTGYEVLTGNGNSVFTPTSAVGAFVGFGPAMADFSGDGKPDILLSATGVDILTNNGTGTEFQDVHTAVSTATTTGVLATDVDGDGRPDAVISASPDIIAFITGSGLVQKTALAAASVITAADFDGDGKRDLAVLNASQGTPSVAILQGNGNGSFVVNPTQYPVAEQSVIAAGDLDGDGKADLVVPGVSNGLQVLINTGGGTFRYAQTYQTGTQGGVGAIVLGDVDRDGRLDAFILDGNGKLLTVLVGRGDGTFDVPVIF
ncbi:MAG TPA: VCBS repeat-containing protein, partial [Polyangia bacterium]|nr:VCBS repeat-containing protein [Polyangia bacterium]